MSASPILGDHANSRGAADMGLLPRSAARLRPCHCARRLRASIPAFPPLPARRCRKCFDAAAQRRSRRTARRRRQSRRRTPASIPRPSRTPSSSCRTSSSPKPPRSPTSSFPPPASTRNPAPSPTPSAMCNWSARPPTAPASSRTSKSSFASPAPWAPTSKRSFPSASAGVTADLGQSRGAQSGEADRHAVWLAANGLEPKLSPFDPLAVLDEIERLVPGYKLDRINLFSGNDVPTEPGFVPVSSLTQPHPDLITSAHDTLFTSGTLGRYSPALQASWSFINRSNWQKPPPTRYGPCHPERSKDLRLGIRFMQERLKPRDTFLVLSLEPAQESSW